MAAVHVPCPHCSSVNRVQAERLNDQPSCGRCKSRLLAEHPAALDDSSFPRTIEASDLPVLVDFWATWCPPCRMMAPQFEAAARQHLGQVIFAKVDTDAARQTAARYGIQSIPTLILFRGGREIARRSGALSQRDISSWLQQQLARSSAA